MKTSKLWLLGLRVATSLTAANFIFQILVEQYKWMVATERSFFGGVAIAVFIMAYIRKRNDGG